MANNSTEVQTSFPNDTLGSPGMRKLGIFDIVFYVTMPGIMVVSFSVLVNIVVDLKRSKAHHRILLGLCVSNIIGSAFGFPYPGLRRIYDNGVATCATVVFFVRVGLLGCTSYVTLLAAERFLALEAPFWYDAHVTGRRAVIVSVSIGVFTLMVSAATFVGRTFVSRELDSDGNQRTRELCSIFPADVAQDYSSLFIKLYVTVTMLNLLLTVVFNTRVVWMLTKMRRQVAPSSQATGTVVNTRQETALLRMVVVFSVISIVSNLPSAALNITRALERPVPEAARLMSTVLLSTGFVLDPCVHLVFTAKYRRRIRLWLRCRFREEGRNDAPTTSGNAISTVTTPAQASQPASSGDKPTTNSAFCCSGKHAFQGSSRPAE